MLCVSQSLTDVARVDLLQQFTLALTPEVDRRRKAAAARVQAVDQSREASSDRADELRAELTALNVHMMKMKLELCMMSASNGDLGPTTSMLEAIIHAHLPRRIDIKLAYLPTYVESRYVQRGQAMG